MGKSILAWAHCTNCSSSYGQRTYDRKVAVHPEDTHTPIKMACPKCSQYVKMYVDGPVLGAMLR